MSYCTIELSIGLVLYLKNINATTALICILKKEPKINGGRELFEKYAKKFSVFIFIIIYLALMDVNLNILKQNIQELFLTNSNYMPRQQINT